MSEISKDKFARYCAETMGYEVIPYIKLSKTFGFPGGIKVLISHEIFQYNPLKRLNQSIP